MYIKQIDNDIISNESEIIVTDGNYELLTYCYPSRNFNKGTKIKAIYSFFSKNIIKTNLEKYIVQKLEDYFSYHLQGQVINTIQPTICIGNISIILDYPLPKDIKENDFIEFDVERLDCEI